MKQDFIKKQLYVQFHIIRAIKYLYILKFQN